MTVATSQLSESLQTLIDSRLDTIDRMLLGRLARQDRLAIVSDVESQIQELLQERNLDELTREHVLAVLARLDPPEAYIPDESDGRRASRERIIRSQAVARVAVADSRIGRASGILGVAAIAAVLLLPVCYLIGLAFGSDAVLIVLGGGTLLLMLLMGVVGLTLGIRARLGGTWALVGIVTSLLAMFLAVGIAGAVGLMLVS